MLFAKLSHNIRGRKGRGAAAPPPAFGLLKCQAGCQCATRSASQGYSAIGQLEEQVSYSVPSWKSLLSSGRGDTSSTSPAHYRKPAGLLGRGLGQNLLDVAFQHVSHISPRRVLGLDMLQLPVLCCRYGAALTTCQEYGHRQDPVPTCPKAASEPGGSQPAFWGAIRTPHLTLPSHPAII